MIKISHLLRNKEIIIIIKTHHKITMLFKQKLDETKRIKDRLLWEG